MTLVEINWNPTNRQLRQFGVISLCALPFLGWLWGGGLQLVAVLAVLGLVLALVAAAAPQAMKPVYLALTIAAIPIGMVIGELAMLMIFFGIFFPVGLIFRLLKRDALQLKIDHRASTYWQSKKKADGIRSYYRQS